MPVMVSCERRCGRLAVTGQRDVGGGYSGLPAKYGGYGGTLVIVDDPATITALTTGGPAATTYLDTALVNKLGSQIR